MNSLVSVLLFLLTNVILYFALGSFLQYLARKEIWFVSPLEGTFGFLLKEGVVVKILYSIKGWTYDENKKKFRPLGGEYDYQGLLFFLWGVIFIGPNQKMRINKVKPMRRGLKEGNSISYELVRKGGESKWVFFQGEHSFSVPSVETLGVFSLDVAETSLYRLLDPNLAIIMTPDVWSIISDRSSEVTIDYLAGKDPRVILSKSGNHKKEIANEIEKSSSQWEKDIGAIIYSAIISAIEPDTRTREFLRKEKEAKLQGKADVTKASFERTVAKRKGEGKAAAYTAVANAVRAANADGIDGVRLRELDALEKMSEGGSNITVITDARLTTGLALTHPVPRKSDDKS